MGNWGEGTTKTARWAGIVALGALMTAPSLAEATTTRIYTLGVSNRFVLDDANRWLYPHMITRYGNIFYLELFGGESSQNAFGDDSNRGGIQPSSLEVADTMPVMSKAGGGAIFKVTDDLFISAHLSDYEDSTVPDLLGFLANSSSGDPSQFPWLPVAPDAPGDANRKFDLFFAYNLQDIAQLGLQLTYGSSRYVRNPNDNDPDVPADLMGGVESRQRDKITTSHFGFRLGGGLPIGEFATVDAGLGLKFHSLGYSPNERNQLVDGGGGIDLNAEVRAMIGASEWWEIVPAISFRFQNLSAADLADYQDGISWEGDQTRRVNITDVRAQLFLLDVGVAGHFKPADRINFWAIAGFQIYSLASEFEHQIAEDPNNGFNRDIPLEFSRTTISIDALPYIRFAAEARLFSWLDFRGGVVKYLRATTIDRLDDDTNDNNADANNDVTRDDPFFDYFVGFGAHYEGFFADLHIDPFWFMRGPQFLSGSGGNMMVNTSIGYRF
ncbi:MAG: hypothetical protein RIT81_17980 [Deltaproteobacteria bacterium]